jgi:glycosyltransferase involved in cell wall biosynthesis
VSTPIVSVIIPAYNAERYLDQALDSVMRQTCQDFECIVVDDGSTDSTPEILARRERVRVIRQPNQGAGAARNTGMHAARGEFLTFLDADNWWYPDRLKVQLDFHRQRPDLDFSHVQLEERIEDGVEPPPWALTTRNQAESVYPLSPGGLMIRRAAMERLGGYNPDFRTGEVIEWLSRARGSGLREERLPHTLGALRIHDHNATYDQRRMRQSVLKALHESMRRKRDAAIPPSKGAPRG